jgi:hypothetical protein
LKKLGDIFLFETSIPKAGRNGKAHKKYHESIGMWIKSGREYKKSRDCNLYSRRISPYKFQHEMKKEGKREGK